MTRAVSSRGRDWKEDKGKREKRGLDQVQQKTQNSRGGYLTIEEPNCVIRPLASVQSPRSRGCARATSSRIHGVGGSERRGELQVEMNVFEIRSYASTRCGPTINAPTFKQFLAKLVQRVQRDNDPGDVQIFQLYSCQPL